MITLINNCIFIQLISRQILGLWESVFPPILGYGDPKRQHIVTYMVLPLAVKADDIKLKVSVESNFIPCNVF